MRRAAWCAFLSIAFATSLHAAGRETISVTFDFPSPRVRPDRVWARVTMGDLPLSATAGEPALPYRPVRILIPRDRKVAGVEIEAAARERVAGSWLVQPAGQPVPLSHPGTAAPPAPNAAVYDSEARFPPSPKSGVTLQAKAPYRILLLHLHPVSYVPARRELSYYPRLTVHVRLAPGAAGSVPRLSAKERREAGTWLRGKVENPDALPTYDAGETDIGITGPLESYPHVIITSAALADAPGPWNFQALRDHRASRGMPSTIVTTDYIYANFSGATPSGGTDNQTRIRNFIAWARESWGTQYVLLGGYSGIIPVRYLQADGTNIPADLYYGNLDGTFDHDADGVYGESTDGGDGGEVDLYAEVHVGRACVENATEVANFVRKTIAYENLSAPSLHAAYMVGEYLGFGGDSQYATQSMDEIRLGSCAHSYCTKGFAESDFFQVSTLYDAPGYTWPKDALISIMNSGVHVLNHLGHANYTYDMKLSTSDLPSLANIDPFLIYSQGCMPGGFDTSNCFGEVVTTMEKGAFAAVLNARYGWGSYNSTAGPSQYYDREFWDALFGEGIRELGRMNSDSKEDNDFRIGGSCMRWCFYELNLFGDPAVELQSVSSRGGVRLDADVYAVCGTATATVIDADLDRDPGASDTVPVSLSSGRETAPELLLLTETGPSTKTFRGSFTLSPGEPVPGDGVLQAAHGDTITVLYHDADDGTGSPADATDTALTDGAVPVISNVRSVASAAFCVVSWETDEPATGTVTYGASAPPGDSASAAGLTTSHSIRLTGLSPLTDYLFSVTSADAVGNTATDANGGEWHRFTTLDRGAILLVDDDADDSCEGCLAAALDAAAYRYDVWDIAVVGASPVAADLAPYKAVVWNCGIDFWSENAGIAEAEEAALVSHLDAGGGLFLCGQDIVYNGVSARFLSDYLHVSAYSGDDGTSLAQGIAGDRLSDGMSLALSYPFTDYSDSLAPGAGACGAFLTDGDTQQPYCAVRFPIDGGAAPHRVVFSAFPFESISASAPDPNNAKTAMDRALCCISPVQIAECSPPYGLNDRPVAVTLRGTGFRAGLVSSLGALQIASEAVSGEQVDTTFPAGVAAGAYDVAVRNTDTMKGSSPNAYTALDPAADDDDDGLRNEVEVLTYGTSPLLADSDADGLTDSDEIAIHHTDPLVADCDADGLLDGEEVSRGIDPWKCDSDDDGLSDYLELMCGADPNAFGAVIAISINFQPMASYLPARFAPDAAHGFDAKGFGWRD